MKKNKIASVVALTILTLSMKPILSSATITSNEELQPINSNHTTYDTSTPSFNVEFKSISSDDKIKEPEFIEHEIIVNNNDDFQNTTNIVDNTDTDEGISFSNVDEEGNQILFVQQTKIDDFNWQLNVQKVETDYVQLAEFMNKGYSVDHQVFTDGNNMLLLSAMQQREGLLNFAINNGANVKYTNKQGQNAYHWAANGYTPEILKQLLNKNNTTEVLNKVDNTGKTPLHFAATSGNSEIVDLLLNNNVDISIKDKDGRSPLFYSLVYGKYDIATKLIKNGADLTLIDKGGTSVEHLILNSDITMYQMSYKSLPKDLQDKIIVVLKDAPQIAYKLANPNITYEKIKEMEKKGIDVNEDIIS